LCGGVWCGVVWCGVVWCGVVWCGVVWCDADWCVHSDGMPRFTPAGRRTSISRWRWDAAIEVTAKKSKEFAPDVNNCVRCYFFASIV